MTYRERQLIRTCIAVYIADIRKACDEDQGTPDGEPGTLGHELQDELRRLYDHVELRSF